MQKGLTLKMTLHCQCKKLWVRNLATNKNFVILLFFTHFILASGSLTLFSSVREKCSNTGFFLVRIWPFFTQCFLSHLFSATILPLWIVIAKLLKQATTRKDHKPPANDHKLPAKEHQMPHLHIRSKRWRFLPSFHTR